MIPGEEATLWEQTPDEVKMLILAQLVQDPDFFKSLLSFMQTSQHSHALAHDSQLLHIAAQYWLNTQNISSLSSQQINYLKSYLSEEELEQFEKDFADEVQERIADLEPYQANGEGLMLAAHRGHVALINSFITGLEQWNYPHYIGEALKTVAAKGYLDLAKMLTEALLTKNAHGRDYQLRSACRLALAQRHWEIVSFLIEKPACSTNSELIHDIFQAAKKANQNDLVSILIKKHSDKLGVLTKLSLFTQPCVQTESLDITKLFNNHCWMVKAPLCFGLRLFTKTRGDATVQNHLVDESLACTSKVKCTNKSRSL